MVFSNPVIREIIERYKPISALRHSASLLEWDNEVYMPDEGSDARTFALAQIALMRQKATIDLESLVEKAAKVDGLTDPEKGIIRVLHRDIDYYRKVPPALLEQLHTASGEAILPWRKARQKSEFAIFEPHLTRIVELKKQEADSLGYEKYRFNALLDLYEEGLTVDDLNGIFSKLIPDLKRILPKQNRNQSFRKVTRSRTSSTIR